MQVGLENDNATIRPQPVRDAERVQHAGLRAAAHFPGECGDLG
jgi:hypothetical protein